MTVDERTPLLDDDVREEGNRNGDTEQEVSPKLKVSMPAVVRLPLKTWLDLVRFPVVQVYQCQQIHAAPLDELPDVGHLPYGYGRDNCSIDVCGHR